MYVTASRRLISESVDYYIFQLTIRENYSPNHRLKCDLGKRNKLASCLFTTLYGDLDLHVNN